MPLDNLLRLGARFDEAAAHIWATKYDFVKVQQLFEHVENELTEEPIILDQTNGNLEEQNCPGDGVVRCMNQ